MSIAGRDHVQLHAADFAVFRALDGRQESIGVAHGKTPPS